MTESTTYTKEQRVKLCKNNNCSRPCLFFCTVCYIQLCYKCSTDHLLISSDRDHNIVNYRDKNKSKLIKPICVVHGRRCLDFCKLCCIPLCDLCRRSWSHNIQSVCGINSEFKKYIYHLQKQLEGLKTIEQDYLKITSKIESCASESMQKHNEMKNDLIRNGSSEISLIEKSADAQQLHLRERLIISRSKLLETQALIHDIDCILKQPIRLQRMQDLDIELMSKFNYVNRVPRFAGISPPQKIDDILQDNNLNCKTYPWKRICLIPSYKVVSLYFPFMCKPLRLEAFWISKCPISSKMWLFSGKKIRRLDLHGKVLETKDISLYFSDVTVTNTGSILYLDPVRSKIEYLEKFPKESIRIAKSFENAAWKPRRISAGWSDCLLVFQFNDELGYGRVLKYDKDGSEVLCIEKDKTGRPLYKIPRGIIELSNESICTIDLIRLLAVNDDGEIIFTHECRDGYSPKRFCCANEGHILALFSSERENRVNNYLTLLNNDGYIVHEFRYYPKGDISGMSIDCLNRLWLVTCMSDIKIINHLNYNKLRSKKQRHDTSTKCITM